MLQSEKSRRNRKL